MFDLVTLGESMVCFSPTELGPIRHVTTFNKHVVGAESNVAIGMSRLGHRVSWLSRLSNDEFGKYILGTLRSEKVDVSQVLFDQDASTSVMFKERRKTGLINVYYYRHYSAASRLSSEDIQEEWIKKARILHLTGITPALSDSCAEAVNKAINIAHKNNVKVSVDPNIRYKLWKNERKMKEILSQLVKSADVLLPSLEEGRFLTGLVSVEEIADHFFEQGTEVVVIKNGKEGAYLHDQEGGRWISSVEVETVDPVGAGDAFAAGFLSGYLLGLDNEQAVKKGNLLGSFAVSCRGDWECLPSKEELDNVFSSEDVKR